MNAATTVLLTLALVTGTGVRMTELTSLVPLFTLVSVRLAGGVWPLASATASIAVASASGLIAL